MENGINMLDICPKIANQLVIEHSKAYDDFTLLWGEIRKQDERSKRTSEIPVHHENGDEPLEH